MDLVKLYLHNSNTMNLKHHEDGYFEMLINMFLFLEFASILSLIQSEEVFTIVLEMN